MTNSWRDGCVSVTPFGSRAMAKRTNRRSSRKVNGSDARTNTDGGLTGMLARAIESSRVSEAFVGPANSLQAVTVGAAHLTRKAVVSAVSGAADIGAEAITATRGMFPSAFRIAGDISTSAQGVVQEVALSLKESSTRVLGWVAPNRRLSSIAPEGATEKSPAKRATRRRGTRGRTSRQPRSGVTA